MMSRSSFRYHNSFVPKLLLYCVRIYLSELPTVTWNNANAYNWVILNKVSALITYISYVDSMW